MWVIPKMPRLLRYTVWMCWLHSRASSCALAAVSLFFVSALSALSEKLRSPYLLIYSIYRSESHPSHEGVLFSIHQIRRTEFITAPQTLRSTKAGAIWQGLVAGSPVHPMRALFSLVFFPRFLFMYLEPMDCHVRAFWFEWQSLVIWRIHKRLD